MSKGSGKVERRIIELFVDASPDGQDRPYTVAELAALVFGTDALTRPQRLSVKRAARSAIARAMHIDRHARALESEAWDATVIKFGREPRKGDDDTFFTMLALHPSRIAARRIRRKAETENHLVHWHETLHADGSVVFHYYDHPVRCWAVTIARLGVQFFEAEIVAIGRRRFSVIYQGVRCSLDRDKAALYGAWWRGVCFTTRQDGYAADSFWKRWHDQFGRLEPLRLPLDLARQMLGIVGNYTREQVITAFRKLAMKLHPDHGGDAEMFRKLIEARDLLLSLIGTKADPVKDKKPTFYPSGTKIVYRVWRPGGPRRIGTRGARLLA